jgi:hypothetical protein
MSVGRFGAVDGGSVIKRLLCEDSGWVCENRPNQPWQDLHACACGGAGAPCSLCNAGDDPPRLGNVVLGEAR